MALILLAAPAQAFHPAVSRNGPIELSLEGPAKTAERAIALTATIRNTGDGPVSGKVRIQAIDDWRATPAEGQSFLVPGRSQLQLAFRATAGPNTYNALYPFHAFADCEIAEKKLTCHVVLVVETQLADPPRPAVAPVDFRPIEVQANSRLALWRVPVHRTVIQLRDRKTTMQPPGWSGAESAHRTSVFFNRSENRGTTKPVIAIHPPWHGQSGTALLEFPLRLPDGGAIELSFAHAIRSHHVEAGEPPSDGVTFRVRAVPMDAPAGVFGEILYEQHSDAKVWKDAKTDLTRFSGRAIRLQFESHPGPKHDTTCDESYWGEPLIVAGTPPPPPPFPPKSNDRSRVLGTVILDMKPCEVRFWPGPRGILDGTIAFSLGDRRLCFRGFQVTVAGYRLDDPASLATLVEIREESPGPGYRVRHRFTDPLGHSYDLLGSLQVERHGLKAAFRLDALSAPKPWSSIRIEDLAAGPWSDLAERVYAGVGNVIVKPEPFSLAFDGHQLATSFVGLDFAGGLSVVQAVDVVPSRFAVDPGAKHYSLHSAHAQTLTFVPATDIWQAVRAWRSHNGLRAGAGVAKLAGRAVFDLWGGRYGPSADALERAWRYGLTDSVVVWHNWQRWGYDYRLPDILPPNPDLGTPAEFRRLADACKRHGVLFAPHDNYIDYYPDADGYSYEHIAFTFDRQPVRAWFNPGPKAQSFRWRADRIGPAVEQNIREIHRDYAPTAYFIDVFSSIQPYDYWTHDGQFFDANSTRDVWRSTFARIREQLGENAPQISESGHDQLVGWLDGAQCNHLRVDAKPPKESWTVWRVACAEAERIAWLDAAHHALFVLHGAGYQDRYAGGLDRAAHGIYSDDYLCAEAMTGHPPMVSEPFGRSVVRKYWLLHDLGSALGRANLEDVIFFEGDIHRQIVSWSNGGKVYVNRGEKEWTIEGHTLPAYGFWATVPVAEDGQVEVAVERVGGTVVEWSRSPAAWYVHAREASGPIPFGPIATDGGLRLTKDGAKVRVTVLPDSRPFQISVQREGPFWSMPGSSRLEAIDEGGKPLKVPPIGASSATMTWTTGAGVFAYQF